MKKILIGTSLLVLFLIIAFFTNFILLGNSKEENKKKYLNNDAISFSTYENPSLPNFTFKYPSKMTIAENNLGEEDNAQFSRTCHKNCAAIQVTSGNDKLEIYLEESYDDMAMRCSNIATSEDIGNGWYRIQDEEDFFYTKSVDFNVELGQEVLNEIGKPEDYWSLIPNSTYKLCVNGTGYFLENFAQTDSREFPVIMSYPRLSMENNNFVEFDNIVRSLEGLKP